MDKTAKVRLSVAIITKNEELRLPDCLKSVEFADEVVVVDSGSTDRTVEIARDFGCRVFVEEWKGDGRQKDSAVNKCSHDWVLVLDADERLSEEARRDVVRVIAAQDSADAYSLPRKCYFHGKWIKHGGWWPDRVVRLFRKSKGCYLGITHGNWSSTGTTRQLDSCIDHYSFVDYEDMLKRLNSYSSFRAQELFDEQAGASFTGAVLHGFSMFFKSYFLKLAILDGLDGLVIASTKAGGSFFKYAKMVERQRHGKP